MKYIQIIKETFLPNYISMFLMLPLRPWMAGVPWSIHFPPPPFSKLIRKSLITGDRDCTWPLMT